VLVRRRALDDDAVRRTPWQDTGRPDCPGALEDRDSPA
jgi:hypothetical protein